MRQFQNQRSTNQFKNKYQNHTKNTFNNDNKSGSKHDSNSTDSYEDGRKLLVSLNPFMLSKQLYCKYNNSNVVTKENTFKKDMKNTFKKDFTKKEDDNFTENALFWCFYRILNDEYEKTKMFQIKQNFCVKLLEQVKQNKGELKECKVKYSDFEQSILYDKDINVEALKVLAKIFKKNIVYVDNIKYYKFFENYESFEELNDLIEIKKKENHYTSKKIEKKERLEQIEKTHFFVENVRKPINSASYYKLIEIKEMASKLNIKLEHQNGKNKTKMELYQEISGCLLQN